MDTKLYVGNVSPETTRHHLEALFTKQGPVLEVKLVMGRSTGATRGFAFVTMATPEAAAAAVEALNGAILGGRFITVSEAHSDENRRESASSDYGPRRSLSKLF